MPTPNFHPKSSQSCRCSAKEVERPFSTILCGFLLGDQSLGSFQLIPYRTKKAARVANRSRRGSLAASGARGPGRRLPGGRGLRPVRHGPWNRSGKRWPGVFPGTRHPHLKNGLGEGGDPVTPGSLFLLEISFPLAGKWKWGTPILPPPLPLKVWGKTRRHGPHANCASFDELNLVSSKLTCEAGLLLTHSCDQVGERIQQFRSEIGRAD